MLAKDLSKTFEEINALSMAEIIGWAAYYELDYEDQKRSMEKSR